MRRIDCLHRFLVDQEAAMREALQEIAEINSGSRNLAGLRLAAEWLGRYFADFPADRHIVELPPREFVTDGGLVSRCPVGPLLRWDYRPQAQRRVLLMIHYDTVFGEDDAFQTCSIPTPAKMQGPGVADAKGGIIVLAAALRALLNCNLLREHGWTVLLNPDEELGSPSSAAYLQRIAKEFDFGLLFEPALPDGRLVSARKGSGNFTLIVRGRAAHAGRHFEQGRNAIVMLARLIDQLDALNGQRPGTTINVGMISGGTAVNVVPDVAVARLNVRFARPEDGQWFSQELQQRVAKIARCEGFQAEVHGGVLSPPKLVTPAMEQLMHGIELAGRTIASPPAGWRETGGVCDGNKLAAAGLPNVDTMGPIGDGLHSRQEWVDLESLPTKALLVAELLAGWEAGDYDLPQRPHPASAS
ncbi:MAG: hypothetical protein KatS3mg111_1637 [Pirellulaceae bacterium]|nr:MAG: hypothetical protein KatS3mg111_1637 [Pirellulaceae bacterium]